MTDREVLCSYCSNPADVGQGGDVTADEDPVRAQLGLFAGER